MAFTLVQLLDLLTQKVKPEDLYDMLRQALERKAGHEDIDTVLDRAGVRGAWRRGLKRKGKGGAGAGGVKIDIFEVAACLQRLQIPLEYLIKTQPEPWVRLEPGDVVVVVLGIRPVTIPGMKGSGIENRAVGARDSQAMAHFVDLVRGQYRLDFDIQFHHLPSDLNEKEAQKALRDLKDRKHLGAIVALGSPLVNPLADLLARATFEGQPPPPALFRWGFDWASVGPRPTPFLSDPKVFPRELEGIGYPDNPKKTTYPRTHDDLIWQHVTRHRNRRLFPDCGMLLMDCRAKPISVVCAGHGGCGTIACVYALGVQERITRGLATSGATMKDQLFEVVLVNRRKPTDLPVDDMVFDNRYGTDWEFWP